MGFNMSENEKIDINNRVNLIAKLKILEKAENIEEALDFACNIPYGDLRALALYSVVTLLEGPTKAELIQKALYSASCIQDEDERALVLSSLACHLKGQDKEKLLASILEFSLHIEYDDAKFQILSSLIPYIDGSTNKEIIEKALDMVSVMLSEYLRMESYSAPATLPERSEEKRNFRTSFRIGYESKR